MYCRNCGGAVGDSQEICLKCGVRPLMGDKYCQNCGIEVSVQQEICIKCGVRLMGGGNSGNKKVNPASPPKNPTTATILAILIVGVGQIYLGQTVKGVVMLVSAMLTVLLAMIGLFLLPASGFGVFIGLAGLVLFPVIYIVSVVDAYKIAKKIQSGRSVGEWEFF